ncbi:hypothetical protein NBE98_00370 [Clostridium swellfunianum]|uniref:hypothetical protein n=1 Tax=Clostridium swellfunianum TaxID=1367462 RepID=UPI0020306FA5|nr:hypothetical protein [Clostridium swellfunianum]MCM0646824.1 hypothetical protein [Clostridium swellfunianum]
MNKTINIARGGLFTALGVLFIYLSTISPTSKIYILGIASCIIPLSIITTTVKNAFFIYLSTSLLSVLLIGFKGSVAAYVLFFGLYGFAKYYIEKLRKVPLEILLKLVFFNSMTGLLYILYKVFFVGLLRVNIPIYAAVVMLQFVFIVFDYAVTLFISYIHRYFAKIL